HAVLPDPVAFWKPLLLQMLDSMQQAGIKIEGDRNALVAGWAPAMWGALGGLTLATLFGSMLLGRWWDSLMRAPGAFGAEYRNLRLGVALGVVVTVVFVLAIVTNSPLIVPLSSMLTMFVLAVWGFADNWLRPRRPASL